MFWKKLSKKSIGVPTPEARQGVLNSDLSLKKAEILLTKAVAVAGELKEQRERNHFRERFLATIPRGNNYDKLY